MSQTDTPLSLRLELKGPLVVAPLGGGPTTPELVASCSNAGALGSLAGAYLSPGDLELAIEKTRSLTSRPFAVNLFAPLPQPQIEDEQFQAALKATRPYRRELGLPDPELRAPFHHDFRQQFEVVLRAKPRVFSFVFGLLDDAFIKACRERDILTLGCATRVEEAIALEESGVDAVVAQGVEAGGHRGIFGASDDDPQIETLALVRNFSSKLRIPVVAAGGLMTGRDIAAALAAGAQAAQLGTAFLNCPEAGTSPAYREALKSRAQLGTHLTRVFSGRWARGIENRFMVEMQEHPEAILPFPAQNAFTRDIRTKATATGKSDFLSLWAGTGVAEIREMPAAELVRTLFDELTPA